MAISIKKPILVVGVSLSFLLWLGENIKNSLYEIGDYSLFGLVLVAGFWLFWTKKINKKIVINDSLMFVNRKDFNKKINSIKRLLEMLSLESLNDVSLLIENFKDRLATIEKSTLNTKLSLTIISQNKVTSPLLFNAINQKFSQHIISSIDGEIFNYAEENDYKIKKLSFESDLVLFILHGDITESEKQIISKINNNQRILVLFNDADYNLIEEKNLVFNSIKDKLKEIIPQELIISISTMTQKVKVKKYIDEINYEEWEEVTKGNYDNLYATFDHIISQTKENFILATAYRNSIELEKNIRQQLNNIRKEKALPLIEKYQIIAATATFANPVSSLDLLATAAINTQMIIDLGAIYQQSLSLNQSKEISIELAKLMVKLGIVEISSQAITTILKTNAITFIAGGIIQGISAAYLTRLCGLSLIAYYEIVDLNNNQKINLNLIKEKLQLVFQQNKDNNLLKKICAETLQFQNI